MSSVDPQNLGKSSRVHGTLLRLLENLFSNFTCMASLLFLDYLLPGLGCCELELIAQYHPFPLLPEPYSGHPGVFTIVWFQLFF